MANTKRDQILSSALTLFVKQGISDTSTASIAKAAGVATGTLFHHFANKQAIVDSLYRQLKQDIAALMVGEQLPTEPIALAQFYWQTSLDWFLKHNEILQFFQLYYATPSIEHDNKQEILKETFGFLFDFIGSAKQAGLLVDLPEDYIVFHCQQSLFTTAQFLIDHPEQQSSDLGQQSFIINFGELTDSRSKSGTKPKFGTITCFMFTLIKREAGLLLLLINTLIATFTMITQILVALASLAFLIKLSRSCS